MSRKRSPSVNENWTKTEVVTEIKKAAVNVLNDCKRYEQGHKFIYVPHPTIRKTFVRKLVE